MSQSILVPMDDSPQSKAALTHALEAHPDAEVTVIHVIDVAGGMAYGEAIVPPTPPEHAEEEAERLFADARDLADDYGVELSTVTERGTPARTINDYIRENDVDHVIMGSHGRTGVNRLIFGSVAERVVRRSPVPVTVVR